MMDDDMAEHVRDFHGNLEAGEGAALIDEHKQMVKGVEAGAKDISRLLIVVEGIPDYNANGEVIGYIGGMRNDITELSEMANGGGGFSIRAKDKAQLIGFMTIVIVALERASRYL